MTKPILDRLFETDPLSCELFWDRENEYREWLDTNPNGFVVNCDKKGPTDRWKYPMLHKVVDKNLSNRENYTTGAYFKVCAPDKESLEIWAKNRGLKLTQCSRKECS